VCVQGGAGDLSDASVVSGFTSDGTWSLMTDVRAGLQRVTQVFITHSANVFMVDYPPVVHSSGREVTSEHMKLEDQVCLSTVADYITYSFNLLAEIRHTGLPTLPIFAEAS